MLITVQGKVVEFNWYLPETPQGPNTVNRCGLSFGALAMVVLRREPAMRIAIRPTAAVETAVNRVSTSGITDSPVEGPSRTASGIVVQLDRARSGQDQGFCHDLSDLSDTRVEKPWIRRTDDLSWPISSEEPGRLTDGDRSRTSGFSAE
jgi:hypothetical protein